MQRSFIYSVVGVLLSDDGAVSTVRHQESISTVSQENWAFSYVNVEVSIQSTCCMHDTRKLSLLSRRIRKVVSTSL